MRFPQEGITLDRNKLNLIGYLAKEEKPISAYLIAKKLRTNLNNVVHNLRLFLKWGWVKKVKDENSKVGYVFKRKTLSLNGTTVVRIGNMVLTTGCEYYLKGECNLCDKPHAFGEKCRVWNDMRKNLIDTIREWSRTFNLKPHEIKVS